MGSAKVGNPYLQQSFYVCGAALSGLGIVTLGVDDEGSLAVDNVARLAVRHQVDALVFDKDDLRPRLRRVAKPARPAGRRRHVLDDAADTGRIEAEYGHRHGRHGSRRNCWVSSAPSVSPFQWLRIAVSFR